MNIGKVTDKIVAKTTTVLNSGVAKIKNSNIRQDILNGSKDLAHTLNVLSENAKAFVKKTEINMKNASLKYEKMKALEAQRAVEKHEKIASSIANDYRMEAYVNEGLASGLNRYESEKGAHALMDATGKFANKNAEESAEFFDNAPEILLQARKEQLIRDYGSK